MIGQLMHGSSFRFRGSIIAINYKKCLDTNLSPISHLIYPTLIGHKAGGQTECTQFPKRFYHNGRPIKGPLK